jgi:hypothetical protein
MSSILKEVRSLVIDFGSSPKLEEMPRNSLADKGIEGPTAAHTIEEIHTPLNFAYTTFTTGSSAMQNIVGITPAEIPARVSASHEIFKRVKLISGDNMLVTYPPLVNVFTAQALRSYGLKWSFLIRSSRDAFLAELYEKKPRVIIGEAEFLKSALEDAKKMGVVAELPKDVIILTAGAPLDLELLTVAKDVLNAEVHDLYGCQEFGWLMLDGCPLRKDLSFVPVESIGANQYYEVLVGGLPMGDSFPMSNKKGHICNKDGKIITYNRKRTYPEFEVVVLQTTVSSRTTIERAARSILRIKGRIVRVDPNVKTSAKRTVLKIVPGFGSEVNYADIVIKGKEKTEQFDDLVAAQVAYQKNGKADPIWKKK